MSDKPHDCPQPCDAVGGYGQWETSCKRHGCGWARQSGFHRFKPAAVEKKTTATALIALADRLSDALAGSGAQDRDISQTLAIKIGPLWSVYTDHAICLIPDAVTAASHEIQVLVTPGAGHVVRIKWNNRFRVGEHRSLPMAVCIAAIRVRAAVMGDEK